MARLQPSTDAILTYFDVRRVPGLPLRRRPESGDSAPSGIDDLEDPDRA